MSLFFVCSENVNGQISRHSEYSIEPDLQTERENVLGELTLWISSGLPADSNFYFDRGRGRSLYYKIFNTFPYPASLNTIFYCIPKTNSRYSHAKNPALKLSLCFSSILQLWTFTNFNSLKMEIKLSLSK